MLYMTPSGYVGEGSPDRADALVWALTELMLGSTRSYDLSTL
jgi:phage terminase large subunit-like protein